MLFFTCLLGRPHTFPIRSPPVGLLSLDYCQGWEIRHHDSRSERSPIHTLMPTKAASTGMRRQQQRSLSWACSVLRQMRRSHLWAATGKRDSENCSRKLHGRLPACTRCGAGKGGICKSGALGDDRLSETCFLKFVRPQFHVVAIVRMQ